MKWEEKLAKQKALQADYKKKGKSPYVAQPKTEWTPIGKPPEKPKNNKLF